MADPASGPGVDGSVNRFELTARLLQRDVMRYTPAGIPVVDVVLQHRSELGEAGHLRTIEVEAPGVAFESVAQRIAACRLDAVYRFRGFVAHRSLKSKRIVFHITAFDECGNR